MIEPRTRATAKNWTKTEVIPPLPKLGIQFQDARLESSLKHLSPKRKTRNGSGVDSWYPYYAGFSFEFIMSILPDLIKKDRSVILDQWNGSGTTTAAAYYLGHIALGFDLNPAVVPIANAKLVTADEMKSMPGFLESCLEASRLSIRNGCQIKSGALKYWMPPTAARFVRASIEWLCDHDGVDAVQGLQPRTSLAALCILHGCRDFAVDQTKSNASWLSPNAHLPRLSIASLIKAILGHAERIIAGDSTCPESDGSRCLVRVGDARRLPLPESSVDLVLSSPPYCTRVDYAKQTGFELAALLGLTEMESRELRHNLMGTTTIRTALQTERFQFHISLPFGISELLRSINLHQSHRSRTYYEPNIRQYFEDAALAVREIARVLRPGGKALLVLQNSYYKEIEIQLSDNYCELGNCVGLHSVILARNPVRRAMTAINSRSRKYCNERNYTEDVVLFEKAKR
jgi:DNA modification methylase